MNIARENFHDLVRLSGNGNILGEDDTTARQKLELFFRPMAHRPSNFAELGPLLAEVLDMTVAELNVMVNDVVRRHPNISLHATRRRSRRRWTDISW